MGIHQKENESLTAYIHHFKTELKDVILQIMWPREEYLSKDLKMLIA